RASVELSPRPLRLLAKPEPIEAIATVPDGPPVRFRWRRALHEVVAADGPERIDGAWWSEEGGPARDYFRVEDRAGLRFWLFRAGLYRSTAQPQWFLHGTFAGVFFCVPVSVFGVPRMTAYVEFAVTSNFSFLRGASHPEELIVQADHLGLGGLGLADRNSVAGVVRAHLVKRENDFALRYHPGSRLV